MTRIDFLDELNIRLAAAGVPDAKDLLSFYDESIRDRMDSGMTEEQAVADVGSIDAIVRNAKAEMPMPLVVRDVFENSKNDAKARGNIGIWIVAIVLLSPILIGILSGLFGLYIGLWGLVFGLFVTLIALGFAGVALLGSGFIAIWGSMPLITSMALWGAGFFLLGLSLLLWHPASLLSKGMVSFIKAVFLGIKRAIVK